eukprot:SAG25_NODE_2280_length_1758_cov_1.537071_1_plen_94_part_00
MAAGVMGVETFSYLQDPIKIDYTQIDLEIRLRISSVHLSVSGSHTCLRLHCYLPLHLFPQDHWRLSATPARNLMEMQRNIHWHVMRLSIQVER